MIRTGESQATFFDHRGEAYLRKRYYDRAIGDFEFFGIVSNLGVFEWKSLFTHQVGA